MAYLRSSLEGAEEDIRRARAVQNGANIHTIAQNDMYVGGLIRSLRNGTKWFDDKPISKVFTIAQKVRTARATLRLIAAGVPHKEAESRGRVETERILKGETS